ncbi:protein TIFY 6a isoform X1 [Selaginella moellendorffii]|uniref:protein TIFY 6a isoform X1 n=1 Tax=Selaginella moellendorffii TaxID=88036 RepID=UPI000D1CAC51|nr:protein TIFY 6a isoform X1 [Selaginella moellendorffii]|eukprot:XP_024543150.1 protein TIFY 6a isoform X1 [Selaginella moellendorffii]
MVSVRPGRIEQHKQVSPDRMMFKVPANSPPPPPSSSSQAPADMAGKRKWQEAFKGESCPSVPAPPHRSPQLTIFYAGAVNVYDNVPENMVKALMTLAAAKSSRPAALMNQIELQRSCSSNKTGFGFQANQSSCNGGGSARAGVKSSSNVASSSTSGSFSFPVLETTSTSLSLNSSYKAANEERSSVPAPAPAAAAAPAPEQSSGTAVQASSSPPSPAASPDLRGMSSRARMQMLPAGLPQARRASIQRFLQKRKQKQVNNNGEDDDEDAATAEMKPTSPPPVGPPTSASTAHIAAQVPHFLKKR